MRPKMRFLHFVAASLLIVFATRADPGSADVFISVDKDTQRMAVLVDGEQRHFWRVSTGLAQYDTPTGSFTPFRLAKDHFSKEWDDAPMPHSIFFTTRGHAIHGSDATKRLGSPASHGCIRLSRENAAILFNLVKEQGLENAKVVVTGEDAMAAFMAGKKDKVRTAERKAGAIASEKDRVQATGRKAVAQANEKDRVQTAAQKPVIVAVARKKDWVQFAEREQRKQRTVVVRASRNPVWAGEPRRRVVQYQYAQPQPEPQPPSFWSPFSYAAPSYGYGWR